MKIVKVFFLAAAVMSSTGCGGDSTNSSDAGKDLAVQIKDLATHAGDMSTGAADMTHGTGDGGGTGMAKTFTITLAKANEAPPCATAGAAATGSATVTINAADSVITVSNFIYTGLSGAATMAHIHSGATGVAGPIVLNFGTTLTSPINKTFTAADYPSAPPTGAPANFAAFIAAMDAGQTYMNVDTTACGAGEIRGQIK
jgi:hypothetical protein